ncbi:septal ring lytic transglycosylase RlpA family protein [Zavarzinia sp.]|uniref:septal ring lytic transglycosylase RlpA family protein n=1 Tax=Zavarzinia sp. TaxID=2027920 RepID=UPI003565B041
MTAARLIRSPALALLLAAAALGACSSSSNSNATTRPGVVQAVLKPYQINGVWYYPKTDWNYDETGIASWYGEPFHGRKTAVGETYDMNAMTAAHKTLQLPVNARVTNLENGRSVIVRINDRGPFVNERLIDLSRRAAQLLGFDRQGTARVRVQVVDESGRPGGGGTLPPASTTPEERTAAAAAPVGTVTATPLAPPSGARGTAGPAPRPATPPSTGPLVAAAPTAPPPPVVTTVAVRPTAIYVQAGAFLQLNNASRLRDRLARYGRSFIAQATIDGQLFYRVRVGPIANVDQADSILDQIIASGETGARIVVE